MKKLLGILVLGLLWCNVGFAKCIEGNCTNGFGTFTLDDGYKYVAKWKDDMFQRQGIETFSDGTKYVGEFVNGLRYGVGTIKCKKLTEKLVWIYGSYTRVMKSQRFYYKMQTRNFYHGHVGRWNIGRSYRNKFFHHEYNSQGSWFWICCYVAMLMLKKETMN